MPEWVSKGNNFKDDLIERLDFFSVAFNIERLPFAVLLACLLQTGFLVTFALLPIQTNRQQVAKQPGLEKKAPKQKATTLLFYMNQ